MRHRQRRAPALFPVFLALAGCGGGLLGPSGAPPALYVLHPPSAPAPGRPSSWQLVVESPQATLDLDSARIAVAPTSSRIDYYAGVAWADRPPAMLQELLLQSFEASGRLVAAQRRAGDVRADFELATDIEDFEAEPGPGGARPHIRLTARLIRTRDRTIVAARTFDASADAGPGIDAVIGGFDEAIGEILTQIVDWTVTEGNRNP
jgi:cholesterol transport system auxiliary component